MVSTFPRKLMSEFGSLSPEQQQVMELLSVIYRPLARTRAMEYAVEAGIKTGEGKRFYPAQWKRLVRELLDRKLLVEQDRQIACNPRILEPVTRHAEREGRLERWASVLEGPSRKRVYRYYESPRDLLGDLRLAIFRNDLKQTSNLLSRWYDRFQKNGQDPWTSIQEDDPWLVICNNPFDAGWLRGRCPEIREAALQSIILHGHRCLHPVGEAVGLAESLLEEGEGSEFTRGLTIEHHLMTGDVAGALDRVPGEDHSGWSVLKGWACFMRGDDVSAIAHYQAAISLIKKGSRKRKVTLYSIPGLFYVPALLRSGEPRHLGAARAYVDTALSGKRHDQHAILELLNAAVGLAEGRSALPTTIWYPPGRLAGVPGFTRLFLHAVQCWAGRGPWQKIAQNVNRLRREAAAGGYEWAVCECDALLRRVPAGKGKSGKTEGEGKGPELRPMADVLREQQPWERTLAALEGLSLRVKDGAEAPGKRATNSRLIWRISIGRWGAYLEPYEQKASKGGRWSKGRQVALKRLYSRDNTAFLTDQDARICEAIEVTSGGRRYGGPQYFLNKDVALPALVGHPQVFLQDAPDTRVDVVRMDPELLVTTEGETVRIKLSPVPPANGNVLIAHDGPTRIQVVAFEQKHREILQVISPEGLEVPAEAGDRIARAVSSVSALVTVHSDIGGGETDAENVSGDARPHFHLTPSGDGLQVTAWVCPLGVEEHAYRAGAGGEVVLASVEGRRVRAKRDMAEESRLLEEAVSACPTLIDEGLDEGRWYVQDAEPSLDLLCELQALGDRVVVAWPEGENLRVRYRVSLDRLSLTIGRQRDWFGVDGALKLDEDLVLTLSELLDHASAARGRYLPLGNGAFIALTDRFRQRLEELATYSERHGNQVRFHPLRAPVFEALAEEAGEVTADSAWEKHARLFREAQAIEPVVPSTLQAELRDYQVEGFRWASRLAAWGAGACLADDMGLGKTVQALAVALDRAPKGPTLVVAPTSVCANWIEEARRFAPTLNPIPFGPGDREETLAKAGPFDLIVCSYGLLHQEAEGVASVAWETVVLDEAQAIKNRTTMRSRAAMKLQGRFRMITTGTPVENHLGELWNLFHFINPGLLGSEESFRARFAAPIQQEESGEAKRRLRRLIQPFTLRRTKTAVLGELPPRTDITLRVEMTKEETALYETLRRKAVADLGRQNGTTKAGGAGQRHLQILAEIMKLRRACCHPRLVMPDACLKASKLEAFGERVSELLDNGHKALVFSQFTDHLAIVREYLDGEGIAYRYLDGSTPARQRKQEVDAFQAGAGDLFLISLRAGGQGLNLTAADYVIHLDPWWNPAVEDQASDRAHRIGQSRPVTVYRLVMRGTIEEKIVDLHATKRDLADSLLQGADVSGKISAEELLELIREGR